MFLIVPISAVVKRLCEKCNYEPLVIAAFLGKLSSAKDLRELKYIAVPVDDVELRKLSALVPRVQRFSDTPSNIPSGLCVKEGTFDFEVAAPDIFAHPMSIAPIAPDVFTYPVGEIEKRIQRSAARCYDAWFKSELGFCPVLS